MDFPRWKISTLLHFWVFKEGVKNKKGGKDGKLYSKV